MSKRELPIPFVEDQEQLIFKLLGLVELGTKTEKEFYYLLYSSGFSKITEIVNIAYPTQKVNKAFIEKCWDKLLSYK